MERAAATHLLDLDEGLLLDILWRLDPLPSLFNVARTCWRLRNCLDNKRTWLIVSPIPLPASPLRPSGRVYATLDAAVAASRPGDTVWLAPTTHELRNVCVPWPLHLLGGGARPEETVLSCPRGADTALDFRANGKVANLCVRATLAPCITHRAGQLSVERCLLSCESGGLDHLCAPLLTLACLCAPPAAGTAAAVAALPRAAGGGTGGGSPVGEGRLTVTECRLLGGLHAVQCRGTGSLQRVRAIYHASSKLFWFEIDCRAPGQLQGAPTSHYGPHQGALGGGCQAADCGSGGAPPPPCQPGKPQPAAGEIAMPGDCNRCVSDAAAVAGVARITEAFAKVSPEVIQALMVAARAPAAVIMPAADATGVSLLGPHPYGAAAVSASASQSSGAEARAPDHAAGSKRRREDSTMLE